MNRETFYSLAKAEVRLEDWRGEYNSEHLHSSLDYRRPDEFAACCKLPLRATPSLADLAGSLSSSSLVTVPFLLQFRSAGCIAIVVPLIIRLNFRSLVLVFPGQRSAPPFFVEFPPTAVCKISVVAFHDPLVGTALGMLGSTLNSAVSLPCDQ